MEKIENFKASRPKIFLGFFIFGIFMLILMTIYPIAMIVIGAKNLDKCKIEPKIPIWLIVSGSFSIVIAIFTFITIIVPSKTAKFVLMVVFGILGGLISLFQTGWFIAGNVWVYSNHGSVNFIDSSSNQYCDRTLYLFTFWTITLSYVMMGVSIVGSIVTAFCVCCCSICCLSK